MRIFLFILRQSQSYASSKDDIHNLFSFNLIIVILIKYTNNLSPQLILNLVENSIYQTPECIHLPGSHRSVPTFPPLSHNFFLNFQSRVFLNFSINSSLQPHNTACERFKYGTSRPLSRVFLPPSFPPNWYC